MKKITKKTTKKKVKKEMPEMDMSALMECIKNPPKIGKIEADFGREDLNLIRNKINELIDYVS